MSFKAFSAAAAFVALTATHATAQDWAGAYAGGTLSYGQGSDSGFFSSTVGGPPTFSFNGDNSTGGRLGGFVGYNWYVDDALIVGVEASAAFGELSGSYSPVTNLFIDTTYGTTATLAVRLAYDAGRALPFLSFGLTTTEMSFAGTTGSGTVTRPSEFRTGTTIGLGVDYQVNDRGFVRVQLSYMGMGDVSYPLTAIPGTATSRLPMTRNNLSSTELLVGYALRF